MSNIKTKKVSVVQIDEVPHEVHHIYDDNDSVTDTGIAIGTIYSSIVTGYVSASWWGWPASFYILAASGFCWCIIWFLFGQNTHASYRRTNPDEKDYIQTSLKQEDDAVNVKMSDIKTKKVSVVQISEEKYEVHHIYEDKDSLNDTGPKFGCRHVQTLLICLGLWCGIGTRTNLSVTIVAMTDNTTSPNSNVPTYNWNNTSIILSSFFWSYISLQVVAGHLGKTYGPKYFLLIGLFVNYCACALTPLAADKLGSNGVILIRIIQGLGQSFLFPSSYVLLGQWAPEEERATLNNFAFSGIPIGTIFSSILTGYISASWWGWPVSFYILSGMGICWCIIWFLFGQNSPNSHPRITIEEKNYIQSSLKQKDGVVVPTPWKKILTNIPFYVLMITYIGVCWGYSVLMTETPTYLAKVMNFDMKSNALVSSMPIALALICNLITGPLSDWVISKKFLSVLNARKYFNVVGCYGQALCLIWLSFLKPSQSTLSVVVLGLSNSLTSFVLVGSGINHLDLSPRFSGVIFGFVNAVGLGFSILGPFSTNWLVTEPTNISQWRLVFLIAAVFYTVGGTVFLLLASAKRQSWDGPEISQSEERRKKVSVVSLMSM